MVKIIPLNEEQYESLFEEAKKMESSYKSQEILGVFDPRNYFIYLLQKHINDGIKIMEFKTLEEKLKFQSYMFASELSVTINHQSMYFLKNDDYKIIYKTIRR